ncbi:MAG: hypothetical protein ACRBM6_32185 [Geminicoccales bacterium]
MRRFCDRAIWLDQGCLKADGKVDEVTKAYVERAQSVKAAYQLSTPAAVDDKAKSGEAGLQAPAPSTPTPIMVPSREAWSLGGARSGAALIKNGYRR